MISWSYVGASILRDAIDVTESLEMPPPSQKRQGSGYAMNAISATSFDHSVRYPVKSRDWLRAVKELQYCTRCSKHGPIDVAHYCGRFAHLFGKGGSQKCSDHMTAALCRECHMYMDQYAQGNDLDRAVEFFICIARTYHSLIESGRIVLCRD